MLISSSILRHNQARLLQDQVVLLPQNKWLALVMLAVVKSIREGSYKMLTKKIEIEMMTHCLMFKLHKESNLWLLNHGLAK